MKNLLLLALVSVCFWGSLGTLRAQDLKDYRALFQGLDRAERVRIWTILRDLSSDAKVGDQLQDDIFEDLKKGLPVSNPTAGIDSILGAWSQGRSNLENLLKGNPGEFDTKEIQAILGAYDQANAGWLSNLQNIQTGFKALQDSVKLDQAAIAEAQQQYEASSETMKSALKDQYQQFTRELLIVGNTNQGPRDWTAIVDKLMNDFGALEVGAGVQSVLATYYDERPDSVTVALLRFGTAPDFSQLWGAEWNAWVSFKNNPGGSTSETTSPNAGLQSMLAGGNVSFQYRPGVAFSKGVMRLITGIGGNFEAYMPARINPNKPQSLNNKGKTTGFGPEVRLGFAVTMGEVGFYSYTNQSRGYVLRCPDYPFSNSSIISGIQWKNLHLRYAHGSTHWAQNNNRHATYNEVSVNVRIR